MKKIFSNLYEKQPSVINDKLKGKLTGSKVMLSTRTVDTIVSERTGSYNGNIKKQINTNQQHEYKYINTQTPIQYTINK